MPYADGDGDREETRVRRELEFVSDWTCTEEATSGLQVERALPEGGFLIQGIMERLQQLEVLREMHV